MSDFGLVIQGQINDTKDEIGTLQSALNDELMKPLNGDLFKRLVVEAQEAAEASAAAADEITGGTTGGRGTNTPGDPEAPEEDSLTGTGKDELEKRLESIREANMSERELTLEKFDLENEDLNTALENELITKQEWAALAAEQKQREEEALTEIEKNELEKRVKLEEDAQKSIESLRQAAVSNAIGLLNVLAGESKAAALASIALTKGLAIAQTIAHTAAAEMAAMAVDPTGVLAARVALMGKINIGLIAATGLAQAASVAGGGGGGGSGGGGGASGGGGGGASQQAAAPPPTETLVANLNVTGQNFDRRTVIGLVEQINDLQEDGMRIRLNTV